MHLDIKPPNILLDEAGSRLWISDSGLARAVHDHSDTLTRTIADKPQFMAPEQLEGGSMDHRADLFSLGCVFYQMSTGQSPFLGDTLFSIMRSVREDHPPLAHDRVSDLPSWSGELIQRLLEKDPDKRLSDAAAVADRLALGLVAKAEPAPTILRPWLPWSIAAAPLLLCVGIGIIWKQLTQPNHPFVIYGGKSHAMLKEAVEAAPAGAIISIHAPEDRLVRMDAMLEIGKPLELRAASGESPIFLMRTPTEPCIHATAPLILSGLHLETRRSGEEGSDSQRDRMLWFTLHDSLPDRIAAREIDSQAWNDRAFRRRQARDSAFRNDRDWVKTDTADVSRSGQTSRYRFESSCWHGADPGEYS
jgi:serine/threonine protein kinase